MLKNLRLGMNRAFEQEVCARWPGFQQAKVVHGQFCLLWKQSQYLEIVFSIWPFHKAYYNEFGISILWSRSGSFDFNDDRYLRCLPMPKYDESVDTGKVPFEQLPIPEYNLLEGLKKLLVLEKVRFNISDFVWYAHSERHHWRTHKFKTFKEGGDLFPLKPPFYDFDFSKVPEGRKRYLETEKSFSIEDGFKLATPIIHELVDCMAIYFWPFVENELIPYAETHPWENRQENHAGVSCFDMSKLMEEGL